MSSLTTVFTNPYYGYNILKILKKTHLLGFSFFSNLIVIIIKISETGPWYII